DWQGARQITSRVKRSELIRIFILPPSMKELEDRLLSRNTDDRISINKRMDEAKNEIKHYNEYDYTIINDNFDKTVETVKSLILARRIGNTSKNEMRNFVKELCNYQY
ncbi:MAG: guanylate kinase, partial [Rickettsiales bacterium]|nr:guanylate kinase [Rickettsiales bacterium]